MKVSSLAIDSKAMAWALQSESKDAILDLCLHEQASWVDMRALGVGFWYTDVLLLRKKVNALAFDSNSTEICDSSVSAIREMSFLSVNNCLDCPCRVTH